MSGQGYQLAISEEQASHLLKRDELGVLDEVNDLLDHMQRCEPEHVHGGYKQWDVLHRCLSDGTFDPNGGSYPLNQCFLGGKLLVSEGSIVNLVTPKVVNDVAEALGRLNRDWFIKRFTDLFVKDYSGPIPDEDYETYYQRLHDLHQFYLKAASERKPVVFYTDDCLDYFFDPAQDGG